MPTAPPPAVPSTTAHRHIATPPPAPRLVVQLPASDEFVGPSGTLVRVARGVSRRARRLWRGVTWQTQTSLVEDAFSRLQHAATADGLPAQLKSRAGHHTTAVMPGTTSHDRAVSPLATALGIATATEFGQHELAARWADGLTRCQRADGAVLDDTGHQASAYATAMSINAWCAVGPQSDKFEHSLAAASRWLAARIEPSGRLRIQPSGCRFDVPTPDVVHLALLAPLARAAERLPDVVSPAAVRRAVSYYRRVAEPFTPSRIAGGHSLATAALWELGHTDDVQQRMFLPSAHQRRSGAVPALPERQTVLAEDVARLARLWFLTGDVDRGNRAMTWLTRHPWLLGHPSLPRRAASSTNTTLAQLDATIQQVSANFRHKRGDVHRTIAAADGRMQAVRQWCAGIDAGAQVADVGCGAGRYLGQLGAERPALRLTGIDVGDTPVATLPGGVAYRQGRMLDLQSERGRYDAVLSVEALQHALLPERAVAEICQLVRSGGQVLIIDKDRRHQALSDHAPWERWFAADEVAGWMAAHCDDVRVTKISHGTAPARQGLFLCWTGVRHSATTRHAA